MISREDQFKLAAKLLLISLDEAKKNFKELDNNAICVYVPVMGGGSIIVGQDGQVLYFGSAISFDTAVKEYNEGMRTPIEEFQEALDDDKW